MYLYNNIFFSKGSDGRGTFEALGGNEAAHVATGKDLEGVKTLNGTDVEGLYTLGSVIVDYKGVRVVAQSIVPGTFFALFFVQLEPVTFASSTKDKREQRYKY